MHPDRDIQRALAGELSERREVRLRAHLRSCERCRALYDEQVLLLRSLAGDPAAPTEADREREVRLALAVAFPGEAPRESGAERRTWAWRPALVGAGLALFLVAIGLGLWLTAGSVAGVTPVAVVVNSSAAVILPEPVGGKEGAVLTGVPVISVAPRGWVELDLRRGGTLRLSAGAQATLSSDGTQLTLVSGRVACQIDPGQGAFQVDTPSAQVRVVGTRFDVEVEADAATRVRVDEGEVEVSDRNGRSAVRLKAGFATRVALAQAPSAPAPAPKPVPPAARAPLSEWELIKQGLRQAGREFVDLFR